MRELLKENEGETSKDAEFRSTTSSDSCSENVAFPSEPVDCIHPVEQSSTVSQNIYVYQNIIDFTNI